MFRTTLAVVGFGFLAYKGLSTAYKWGYEQGKRACS